MVEVTAKMIGEWYKEEFEALRKFIPLKERHKIATDTVRLRIRHYDRIISLTNFIQPYPYQKTLLKKIWDEELGEH